jgi:high-affinity iron transporter
MFGVAFLAVYREAFETVLFYEALLTETDGGGTAPVVLGFAAGVLLLTVVAFGILRLSKKLPIRAFFTVSGALLYALAFVFAGAGIHALVEGGYLDPRPIRFPTIEWLGIYPDLLGLGLQAAFVAAVALGLMFELRSRRRAVAAT